MHLQDPPKPNLEPFGTVDDGNFVAISRRLSKNVRVRELIAAITLAGIGCIYFRPANLSGDLAGVYVRTDPDCTDIQTERTRPLSIISRTQAAA
jgi:hypothetical protein